MEQSVPYFKDKVKLPKDNKEYLIPGTKSYTKILNAIDKHIEKLSYDKYSHIVEFKKQLAILRNLRKELNER